MAIPSLIHELFARNKFKYISADIENTGNGIWLKYDNVLNPDNKKLSQLKFIELLHFIVNNSVAANKKSVNYLLWSDVDGFWYFKTLDSLIKEKNNFHTLYINPDLPLDDKISNLIVIKSNDNIANLESKIFYSSYKRIDPDYTNAYLDFTDTNIGTTSTIEFYDYIKDFSTTQHIYNNPLITKEQFHLTVNKTQDNSLTNIQETYYGYFDTNQYNTSTPVWWDYLGKKNDKHNNISWQTQFDITNLSFPLFHKIHTEIRVPLIQKRLDFNRLKNIKRKWEAYRCVVCCMDQPIGSAKDLLDFQAATNDPFGNTFTQLFGPNGLFMNKPYDVDYISLGHQSNAPYGVIAAGSFTDQFNYDKTKDNNPDQNGLSLSRDLSKAPYNQTIGQFYNLGNESSPQILRYKTQIIDNGILQYTQKIDDNKKRLVVIKEFIEKVDSWIEESILFIQGNLTPCVNCHDSQNTLKTLTDVNNYWSRLRHSSNNNLNDFFTNNQEDLAFYGHVIDTKCGYDARYGGPDIPVFQKNIAAEDSHNNHGSTGPSMFVEGIGNIPYFEIPQYNCLKTINFAYDWSEEDNPNDIITKYQEIYKSLVVPLYEDIFGVKHQELPLWAKKCSENIYMKGQTQGPTADYYNIQSNWSTKEKCIGSDCYNEYCFNPNILLALKQIAARQFNILKVENFLLKKIQTAIVSGISDKWLTQYTEWVNRKAFFHSKQPGTAILKGPLDKGYRGTTLTQPLSLQGIKRITRKDIRGSRYEILAKARGITGATMGNWLYNIFFDEGNGGSTANLSGNTANPYYEQKYKTNEWFFSDRYTFRKKSLDTRIKYYSNHYTGGLETEYTFKEILNTTEIYGISGDGIFTSTDQPTIPGIIAQDFVYSFNIFTVNQTTKPANLKREEIASYMRIEFDVPIGLDRIQDFPDGFVRNAGVEYFLPYLVSLTSGPMGRQAIRNNVAIIGMDPYGFDVAIKKMKVNSDDMKNSWWWENGNSEKSQTELSRNGMELWPEPMFETKFPYYAADSRGIYSYSSSYSGYESNDLKWNHTEDHHKRSAEVDPERRKTSMGSNLLMSSHRKIKPHRSWWSFHLPHNIFIPQKLYSILTTDLSNVFKHGYHNIGNAPSDEFDGWLAFNPIEIDNLLHNTNFNNIE